MFEMSRTCVVCLKEYPNVNQFELICRCSENNGVCRGCYGHAFTDHPNPSIAEIREYGRRIIGDDHALLNRDPSSSDDKPQFTSLMLQDIVVQHQIEAFFGRGRDGRDEQVERAMVLVMLFMLFLLWMFFTA
jgi:hypothetical protein